MKKVKSILKGTAGFVGISLIDPIEVYFLPHENTFYPIISKSGCSSIKLLLIQVFKPEYENVFPGIHKVDPAKITDGKLERLYFKTESAYAKWAEGKKMIFVMREPISRFYSCYLDVIRGKNTMYKFPSGLDWYYKYATNLTFDEFTTKVTKTPDTFSDRHFRSQSFYLTEEVLSSLSSLTAMSLRDYMQRQSGDLKSNENETVKLNSNKSSIPDELRLKLNENTAFKNRFKEDFQLFDKIKTATLDF